MFGSLKRFAEQFCKLFQVYEAKTSADLKQDVLIFDSAGFRGQTDQKTCSHFTRDVKCFKFGRTGLPQIECRANESALVCYKQGEKGQKVIERPRTKRIEHRGSL